VARLRPDLWRRAVPVLLLVAVAAAALAAALMLTPTVSVSTFGQVVDVGAVPPSLSLSGPGQADLFGEGSVKTVQTFAGPVRPLLVWKQFNRNDQAGDFIQSTTRDGHRVLRTGAAEVGDALLQGWTSYFVRLVLVAGAAGGVIYLLALGVGALLPGWPHERARRRRWASLGLCVAVSLALAAACTGLTVVRAGQQLAGIQTLGDIVGTVDLAPVPAPAGPVRKDVDLVVIGDSTAAAVGNTPLADPGPADQACGRSADAYAEVLALDYGYRTLNLACSGATIRSGLLGPQSAGGMTLPAQVGVLESIPSASVVIVSVGANDVDWTDALSYCYGMPACNDQASDQLFQSYLDAFKIQYTQLLQQLGGLPSHPVVVVNLYYDPFGDTFDCPALQDPQATAGGPPGYGFGPDPGQHNQAEKITTKIDPLESERTRLNAVLRAGAEAFGDLVAEPRFDGHALCSAQPWVQGLKDPNPFHPTAAGELAIAAADIAVLPPPAPSA
jgi:lysophospholipase L1-like esterase